MKHPITWVICAAGEGLRFAESGFRTPKPLLKLRGKSMLEWALKSLPLRREDTLIIISLKRHKLRKHLGERLGRSYPALRIVWREISRVTGGQTQSFLLAKKYIPRSQPLAIFNCDTYFRARKLRRELYKNEGIIPCAQAAGSSWSFCRTDRKGQLTAIAEKKRISSLASVGLYGFRDPHKLIKKAEAYVKSKAPQGLAEHYIAPLYAKYIDDASLVKVIPVQKFRPFGSPEQLKTYWKGDRIGSP